MGQKKRGRPGLFQLLGQLPGLGQALDGEHRKAAQKLKPFIVLFPDEPPGRQVGVPGQIKMFCTCSL